MSDEDRRDDQAQRGTRARQDAKNAERSRRLILERRARFVAAALAGSGISANACTTDKADRYESNRFISSPSRSTQPDPCLSPPPDFTGEVGDPVGVGEQLPPRDAGSDDDANAEPQPCLTPE